MTKYNITPFLPTSKLYHMLEKAQGVEEELDILIQMDSYMMQDVYSYVCTNRVNTEEAERLWALWRQIRDAEEEQ